MFHESMNIPKNEFNSKMNVLYHDKICRIKSNKQKYYHNDGTFVCLFDLILHIPVNNMMIADT